MVVIIVKEIGVVSSLGPCLELRAKSQKSDKWGYKLRNQEISMTCDLKTNVW